MSIQHSFHFIFTRLVLLPFIFFPLQQTAIAADTLEKSGDALLLLLPAIAYGSTFYANDAKGRTQFYKAAATNLIITQGLKYATNKERPNKEDNLSFPSGHSSVTFQAASFIHKRYGTKYALPAYMAATLVGYSRVKADKHYTEDVLAGAALGIMSSFYFTKPYKSFTLKPIVDKDTYGLSISKQW
ncbi:MAG TPA: phosphatase PAP2 family protein [Thiothrix sp.]|nr:phosphatase PAP2 family protein [Thiothrix sp.]